MAFERLKGYVGRKIHGITLNIDIINACPFRCPTCAVSMYSRKGYKMTPQEFKKIITKAKETKIRKVQLYVYSDPCLHPELDKFIDICEDTPVQLSTMLHKTQCDWKKVIQARPAELRISYSGKNMEKYQVGSNHKTFMENLDKLCKMQRLSGTKWTMMFHIYKDNQNEIEDARILAHNHGLEFIPLPAIFMIGERIVDKNYSQKDLETISWLLETPEEAIARMKVNRKYCILQDKQITLDSKGRVYLCELLYEDDFILGHYNNMDYPTIRNKINTHSFCDACKKAGNHTYQYCYGDPTKFERPVEEANKKRFK